MQASIYKILPFDASLGTTIKFAWNGNQVLKNRCIIRENETNKLVYDNTITSYTLEHPIDLTRLKTALTNGKKYNAYITVFDKSGIESDLQSPGSAFLCLKTPVFHFVQIEKTLVSSTHTFSLTYSQENGELLNSWSINIYSRDHALLSTSGVTYATDNLSYSFSGFNDKAEYYVRGLGQTVNGMELDTGFIGFSVHYDVFNVFSMLELANIKKSGAIYVKSNIVTAKGYPDKEPASYIKNEYIDLRNNRITFKDGFLLDQDYTFVCVFYGMNANQELICFYNEDPAKLTATVTYRTGKLGSTTAQGCFELKIVSNGVASVYYSNKITVPSGTDRIGIIIYRRNGYYSIKIKNLGKE